MVGKWDAGMATPEHTPLGRGFESSLCYFHHANDYFTRTEGVCRSSNTTAGDPITGSPAPEQRTSQISPAGAATKPAKPTKMIDLWRDDRT